jgi:hypothetical protein
MRVGVKFCGNCNPLADLRAVMQELSAQANDVAFVAWDDDEYDVLLILSSCSRDCATRPAFAGPLIEATDASINGWPVATADLPAAILAILRAPDRNPNQSNAPCASARDGERVSLSGAT